MSAPETEGFAAGTPSPAAGRPPARDGGAGRRHALSLFAEIAAIAGVPAVLAVCIAFRVQQTAVLSLVAVLGCLLTFFAGLEHSRPRLRDTMPIAVLAALAAAGRILFAPFPSFKPVSAIAIIAGGAFGRRSGFLVGVLAALVSNFFFGQGPWSPWQMYGWGLVGWLGGVLASAGLFGRDQATGKPSAAGKAVLLGYGFLSGPLYGIVLNLWSIVGFYHPETIGQAAIVYAAALPFDIVHGIATVVFLAALYFPWQRKLARVKRKFGLRL